METFRENVIRIIGSYFADREPTEYNGQIDSLHKRMMTLIEGSAKLENADGEFDRQQREIANQIKELKKKKSKRIREIQLAKSYEQRVQNVDGYIKKTGSLKRQFDDDLVRRLIQSIKVIVMKQSILCGG
ncbi:MAG: Site-specific recombinase [Clostridium sp.]|nr:Site-specific recombinase [Clostridium sp.]